MERAMAPIHAKRATLSGGITNRWLPMTIVGHGIIWARPLKYGSVKGFNGYNQHLESNLERHWQLVKLFQNGQYMILGASS